MNKTQQIKKIGRNITVDNSGKVSHCADKTSNTVCTMKLQVDRRPKSEWKKSAHIREANMGEYLHEQEKGLLK